MKVLLSQNVQRAVANSGGGSGGWVHEVSLFRISNFVDKEMLESLMESASDENEKKIYLLGDILMGLD